MVDSALPLNAWIMQVLQSLVRLRQSMIFPSDDFLCVSIGGGTNISFHPDFPQNVILKNIWRCNVIILWWTLIFYASWLQGNSNSVSCREEVARWQGSSRRLTNLWESWQNCGRTWCPFFFSHRVRVAKSVVYTTVDSLITHSPLVATKPIFHFKMAPS